MTLSSDINIYQSLETIDKLIENGQPNFGVFAQVKQINYLDYHSHLISQKALSNWRKEFKVNQFCFMQIVQPPFRVCLALATIKVATTAFVYLYNEDSKQLEVCETIQPLIYHASFDGDHYQGQMRFQHHKLKLTINFSPNQVMIDLDDKHIALKATLERKMQPLAICTPTGRRGWSFTQKEPFTKVLGHLLIKSKSKLNNTNQNERIVFTNKTCANLDWTLGYMRHKTNWFWSCINSYLPDGRHFLLNLSMGVNETGISENACWLDGKIAYLPSVLFKRDNPRDRQSLETDNTPQDNRQPWQIYHQDLGWSKVKIELTFKPIAVYKKTDNFGVVASIFEQWLGEYSGEIQIGEQVIKLNKVLGLAEDHFAKW